MIFLPRFDTLAPNRLLRSHRLDTNIWLCLSAVEDKKVGDFLPTFKEVLKEGEGLFEVFDLKTKRDGIVIVTSEGAEFQRRMATNGVFVEQAGTEET